MTVLTVSTDVFACHSKACAPPPVGKGGSSGPFTAAQLRSILKDELAGTRAGTREVDRMRGVGTRLSSGIGITRPYKSIPWMMKIEADGPKNEAHLAAQFPAIRKKLKALGYGKVEPTYSYGNKSRIFEIWLDEF